MNRPGIPARCFLPGLILSLVACTEAPAPNSQSLAETHVERPYGYHLGDLVPVHYVFRDSPDHLMLDHLKPGPVNDWLMIHRVQLVSGANQRLDQTELEVTYQIFKGVSQSETLTIPPLSLDSTRSGSPPLVGAALSVTLVPVIPPDLSNEEIEPQLGSAPPKMDTSTATRRASLWLSVLAFSGVLQALRLWLVARRPRPFRQSASAIRTGLQPGASIEHLKDSLKRFHRALDQTQGSTVFEHQLSLFLGAHPPFANLEADLLLFFSISSRLFFIEPESALEEEERLGLIKLLARCLKAEQEGI